MQILVYVSPVVRVPNNPICTSNANIVRNFSGLNAHGEGGAHKERVSDPATVALQKELSAVRQRNDRLTGVLAELCNHLAKDNVWSPDRVRQTLKDMEELDVASLARSLLKQCES